MRNIKISIVCILLCAMFPFRSYGEQITPADIIEKYGNSVVLIVAINNNKEVGQGSGFVVKQNGVIVTNFHVINNAFPAAIKLINGEVYEDISVIGFDEEKDIAVIKIEGFNLPTAKLGNSNMVRVGERVVVIGNPLGYENTISEGLLSQIRDFKIGHTLHQISAPISPGSSGSPVFNEDGEVIGLVTSSAIEGQNVNFSIPINYVIGMINGQPKMSLEEFSKITERNGKLGALEEGYIGIELVSDYLALLAQISEFWSQDIEDEIQQGDKDAVNSFLLYLSEKVARENERFQKRYSQYVNYVIDDKLTVGDFTEKINYISNDFTKCAASLAFSNNAMAGAKFELMGDSILQMQGYVLRVLAKRENKDEFILKITPKQKDFLLSYIEKVFGDDIRRFRKIQNKPAYIWNILTTQGVLEGRSLEEIFN